MKARPVESGPIPSTFWRYIELSRKRPKIEPAAASIRKSPPPTARSANRSIRRSGVSVRRSKRAKARSPARPPRPIRCVWVEVQPGALALSDREDDRAETRRCEQGAAEVETLPARLQSVGRDGLKRGDRERGRDGEIDVEDQAPVELGQDAADEHADRSTGAADRAPGSKRLRPLGALEGGHDDREGSRGEHRRPEALSCASGEQGTGGTRHCRGKR